MKKVYYKSKVAYFGQVFIWIMLFLVFLTLFLISGDYSKDNIKVILVSILIVESIASLCAPATLRKIVFYNCTVSVKVGFICLKKLNYDDIKYISIFTKMSGPHPISCVFFSKQFLSKDSVNMLFDKQNLTNRADIIFCDYPQKDLDHFLKTTFVNVFRTESTDIF